MKDAPTFWDYLFVTPGAYVRVLDFPYQLDAYAGYHRRFLSKLIHCVCVTPNLLGLFILFSYLNLGILLLAVLLIWYLRMDFRIGTAAVPALALLWLAGNSISAAAGSSALQVSLAVIGVCSLLTSLSHSVEDVPPPLSNRGDQWAPVREWVRETSIFKKILLLVWGTFLEVITAPRLFPVVLYLGLTKLGFGGRFKLRR
jgi:hypothetical protein